MHINSRKSFKVNQTLDLFALQPASLSGIVPERKILENIEPPHGVPSETSFDFGPNSKTHVDPARVGYMKKFEHVFGRLFAFDNKLMGGLGQEIVFLVNFGLGKASNQSVVYYAFTKETMRRVFNIDINRIIRVLNKLLELAGPCEYH